MNDYIVMAIETKMSDPFSNNICLFPTKCIADSNTDCTRGNVSTKYNVIFVILQYLRNVQCTQEQQAAVYIRDWANICHQLISLI